MTSNWASCHGDGRSREHVQDRNSGAPHRGRERKTKKPKGQFILFTLAFHPKCQDTHTCTVPQNIGAGKDGSLSLPFHSDSNSNNDIDGGEYLRSIYHLPGLAFTSLSIHNQLMGHY